MKKIIAVFICATIIFGAFACGCSSMDKNYGKSAKQKTEETTSSSPYKNVKIPVIKSDDDQMPTFFDISLYDEENYSDIYLGKDYKYKFNYAGSEINVPSSISEMEKLGWTIADSTYSGDTQLMAGKSVKVEFRNDYGNRMICKFFNSSNTSAKLSNCKIVKVIISENSLIVPGSLFGQFNINGVSNSSAITDVVEYLGAPSHFYAVSETQYYLDYFLTSGDKRCGITVYIDVPGDCVTAIEVSMY